jgi:hypothetical protein
MTAHAKPDPALIPEARELVAALERGDVTLSTTDDPHEVYCGHIEYKSSNGWTLIVFNDCDDWDYFDHIEAPDGRWLDYDTLWDHDRDGLAEYEPTEEQMGRVWLWP